MFAPGQILHQRYELQRLLSRRPGRQTWLAQDLDATTPEAEPVVIKLLGFSPEIDWQDLKLFQREAQVLQQITHPRIPEYRDAFTLRNGLTWWGLVATYIEGASLADLIRRGKRFTPKAVYKLATQVLRILIALHELSPPVLHRDIKPSNLIVSAQGQVFLVDFGSVQDRASREGGTFTVVGTYGYTPLEQFGGRTVPASDLYALGATLIHILTGVPPAELPQEDFRIQFRDRVSLNPAFLSWLACMSDPNPEKRFPTAREALRALQFSQRSTAPVLGAAAPPVPRIQVQPTAEQLNIEIAQRWEGGWTDALLVAGTLVLPILGIFPLGGVLMVGALARFDLGGLGAGLLLWVLGALLSAVGVSLCRRNFTASHIRVTPAKVTVRYRLFGIPYWQWRRPTAAIKQLMLVPIGLKHHELQAQLTTQNQNRSPKHPTLAINLSETECQWLIQTLYDWLDRH